MAAAEEGQGGVDLVVVVVSAAAATGWEAAGSVKVVDLDWEAREETD